MLMTTWLLLLHLLLFESTVQLAPANHFLAVGIEGVVDKPFRGIEFVIILVPEVAKALGNRVQASRLRLLPERVVGVGAVDNLRQEDKGWITVELVLFHEGLERTLLAVVAEL